MPLLLHAAAESQAALAQADLGMASASGSCQHYPGEHAEQSAQRWQQLVDAISAYKHQDSSLTEALRRTGFMATLSELVCLTALKGAAVHNSLLPPATLPSPCTFFSFCHLQGLTTRISHCLGHTQRWWHTQAFTAVCLSAFWQLETC